MHPKKILFINDVAFCAKDAVRLLLHKADIACGLDFAHYEVASASSGRCFNVMCPRT